jgi:hypothetical protein
LLPKIEIEEIRIRAFQATADPESSQKFAQGHLDVLKNFGLNLSSTKNGWMNNPSVYVILIESPVTQEVYGGARIEIYDGHSLLPIVGAVGEEAPEIRSFLDSRKKYVIGEICGLWNSMAVAGMGIGSTYSIRSAIALAEMIGVHELVALCSPYTYRIAHQYGFNLLEEVGNKGAIPYAGANEIAHVTYQSDVLNLPGATEDECNIIQDLRKKPIQTKVENGRKKSITVYYNLFVSGSKPDCTCL